MKDLIYELYVRNTCVLILSSVEIFFSEKNLSILKEKKKNILKNIIIRNYSYNYYDNDIVTYL